MLVIKESKIVSTIQFMPDGPKQDNIEALLRRGAGAVKREGQDDIVDIILENTRVVDDKPGLAIYREIKDLDSYKVSEVMDATTLSLPQGEDQGNLANLLEEAASYIRSKGANLEIYNVSLADDMNERGSHYKLTIYYAKND